MITQNIKKLISLIEGHIDSCKYKNFIWPIVLWFLGLFIVFLISMVIKLIFLIGE